MGHAGQSQSDIDSDFPICIGNMAKAQFRLKTVRLSRPAPMKNCF